MIRALRRIWLGCGYLPGYGAHPGSAVLVAMVLLGAAAGMERGVPLQGALVMALFAVPIYLTGAYWRGRDYEQET